MDFLPTFAELAGTNAPDDRIIDGTDISEILLNEKNILDRTFLYYTLGELCAIRYGKWKYFVDSPNYGEALYNLKEDLPEENNLLEKNPEVVTKLKEIINKWRNDIDDDLVGIEGKNCRPIGRVDNPKTLTTYDPSHPYMIAEYDLSGGNHG